MDIVVCAAIKGLSLGMININPTNESVVFKDPFTGVADLFKLACDADRDLNKGVWIGTRPINQASVGFSSAGLRFFNADIMHQAVMVDGIAYSLVNDKGSTIRIQKISYEQKNMYEWRYRGQTETDIESIVEAVNKLYFEYNSIISNCQDVSDSLSKYALGIYNKSDCLFFIIPSFIKNIPEAVVYGILFQPTKPIARLITDIIAITK